MKNFLLGMVVSFPIASTMFYAWHYMPSMRKEVIALGQCTAYIDATGRVHDAPARCWEVVK